VKGERIEEEKKKKKTSSLEKEKEEWISKEAYLLVAIMLLDY
jgi:hypothetical protein